MSAVDLRLDGRTLVRLIDATSGDVRAVERRLGLPAIDAGGDTTPELTIRYADGLPIVGRLRTVGRDEGAFTDDVFVVRRGTRPIAILRFERIGGDDAEILVERGAGAPAQLVSLVNLGILGHGRVALHAAAVVHEGRGIAACGWSGSGKTEVLLGYLERGASAVGDEWIDATPSSGRLVGLPSPIRVQDWHLEQLPGLRGRIGRGSRLAMAAAAAVERSGRGVAGVGRVVPGSGALRRTAARAGAKRHIDVPPATLFGAERLADAATLDIVFLLETGTDDTIRVEPIDPAVVAARMALAHVHHRRALLGWYWQARFAFPDRSNPLLERIEAVERERLTELFVGRPAFRVDHPHRVDITELVAAMEAHGR